MRLPLKTILTLISIGLLIGLAACREKKKSGRSAGQDVVLSPEKVRQIAKEAYIYAYPIVDNLRVQYAYFFDKTDPEYKTSRNNIFNVPRVFTPKDRIIQTPNSDTPFSFVGLDLRAEPVVFIISPIEKNRYWSLQLIDLYTFNFDYLGSRTTGNNGGAYMIAGPNWKGETPKGIDKVIRCETEIASGIFRTQLYDPNDLENVKKVQLKYVLKPLSAFMGQPAPPATPAIDFPKPLSVEEQKSSLDIFKHLNFALQFCPTHPSEKELMEKFSLLNIGAGKTFDTTAFSTEVVSAMHQGVADAWKDLAAVVQQSNEGKVSASDVFGTRDFLNGNYMFRMVGAVTGIYGNSREEAMYPNYFVDTDGNKLDGANTYAMRFAPGQLPPVNAFWSLTMYDSDDLLVENPLNRYLLNSTMLSQFRKDTDGGLTLLIQHESPGKNKEANWLPAPAGSFRVVLRLYWPKPAALEGSWKHPVVKKL